MRLDELDFVNRFTSELPVDPSRDIRPRQVFGACSSLVAPTPVADPRTLAVSPEVAADLEIDPDELTTERFAAVFGGNELLAGMEPFAMCYGGHQFGSWAGQLGDGRAIGLGEVRTSTGAHHTLQLKGSGPTPYSRRADGRAVLRSSVREFLCSEAMVHLGVPTTRALSLVATGDAVVRDMFYDGHPAAEAGAIVCRVAPSFTRFGNFEIFGARNDHDTLATLAEFTLRSDFPHLGEPSPEVYAEWFTEICTRTAELMVHWMRVGFVHGVMNTDNLSILGLTIDYGPYGWLENYDPDWTPNTTDAQTRRYRYGNQPAVAHWNLLQLANAIYPLVNDTAPLEEALDHYASTYEGGAQACHAEKLGLASFDPDTDTKLVDELLAVLQLAETDMTIFYRRLADVGVVGAAETSDEELRRPLADAYYVPEQITPEVATRTTAWLRTYAARVDRDGTPDDLRAKRMNATNPKYVLRNYLAQLAIDRADEGDSSLIVELLDVLRRPYDEQPEYERHAAKRPDWARERAGCSMLSCSS